MTSQVDFSIEKPKDYINLSDLMDSATMLVGFGSRDVGSSSNSSSSRRGSSVSTPSRASSIREVESSAGRR